MRSKAKILEALRQLEAVEDRLAHALPEIRFVLEHDLRSFDVPDDVERVKALLRKILARDPHERAPAISARGLAQTLLRILKEN